MNVPPWLLRRFNQMRGHPPQGIGALMGRPDFTGAEMDPSASMAMGMTPQEMQQAANMQPPAMDMNTGQLPMANGVAAMGGQIPGRFGTPAPQQMTGPPAMGMPAGMTDQGLMQQFPTGMDAPTGGGPGWAGMASMAGGLLSESGKEERAPMPVPQRQAIPIGPQQMSLYDLTRQSRGY